MAWSFPDGPFDLVVESGKEFLNCRLVESDAEHLPALADRLGWALFITVDFDHKSVLALSHRLRAQVRLEDVRLVVQHAVEVVPEVARYEEEHAGPIEASASRRGS